MTADEGLECLVYIIDTQSLPGTSYLNEIDGHVRTLEEAFEKLFQWSRHNSNHTKFLRDWRNLKISLFKTDGVTWFDALERLYEQAVILQDQLDDVHRPPQLLLEFLETAVQEQPFYLFVDRLASHNSPHAFYQNCRLAIQKHAQHSGKASFTYLAAANKPETYQAHIPEDVPNLDSHRSHTNLIVKDDIAKALYSKSGRRCRYNNRSGSSKRIDSKDKGGNIRI